MRAGVLLLSLCIARPAFALDAADAGTYAVVRSDTGAVTDKVFRFRTVDGRWVIEDRGPDGAWKDLACDQGCTLNDTTRADVERYFTKADLDQIVPTCVNNTAFAFCRYALVGDPEFRGHVLVALKSGQAIKIRLARGIQRPAP